MKFKFSIIFIFTVVLAVVGMLAKASPVLASCDPTGNPPGDPPVISAIVNPTGTYTDPLTIPVRITGQGGYECSGNPSGGMGWDMVDVTVGYDIINSAGVTVYSGYWSANRCTVPICIPRQINVNHTVNSSIWPSGLYTINVLASGAGGEDTASSTFTINRTVLMTGTLTPPSSTCSIPAGQNTCTQTLNWTTTHPVGTSAVTNNGGAIPASASGNNGSQLFSVRYNTDFSGVTTFYLYNNAQELAVAIVTTSCADGTTWNGTVCSANTPPSGTISATSCKIANGSSTCDSSVTWDTQNRVAGANTAVTRNNPNNTEVSTATSGSGVSNAINYGSSTFYLYHNNLILAQTTVTASCAKGTAYNGTICTDNEGPVDGYWDVGPWGPCENGIRTRTVTCVPPVNGGQQCPLPSPMSSESCTNLPPVNGQCSSPARHYGCETGTSVKNVSSPSRWTWYCNGSNGGTNSSQCSEKKSPIIIEN